MDVILIPGLWLDASSWDGVVPTLEGAGHTVHALTMPGVGASADESADIGIAEWVDAVVAEIDRIAAPVVVVGHSGGGNVAWGAADARPDRVRRVIFLDTMPPPDGSEISEFALVDGVIPFPGWDSFDDEEVSDLDQQTRAVQGARTKAVPARVPTDPIRLTDSRRHSVPVTILSGQLSADTLPTVLAEWGRWADEFAALEDAEVVTLGSGHWPQFSQPEAVGEAIVAAIR